MVKEWPKKTTRDAVIRVSDPAMEWHEINLNELLACARRELSFRQRCYPKWVATGRLSEAKADKELQGMRQIVDFLTHCVFKAVTRGQDVKSE